MSLIEKTHHTHKFTKDTTKKVLVYKGSVRHGYTGYGGVAGTDIIKLKMCTLLVDKKKCGATMAYDLERSTA